MLKSVDREKEAITEIVRDLGIYYNHALTDKQIAMYVDDLLEMGSELTNEAAAKYRRKWAQGYQFPLPSMLRATVLFTSYGKKQGYYNPAQWNLNITQAHKPTLL